jgi:DNA-directed RNA polymerase specialized sigma54-like protein
MAGRHPIAQELQALIRRMAADNRSWGQRRIQGELARLGFKVSARTVAKYMTHASKAITGLAVIPEATRSDHLGV